MKKTTIALLALASFSLAHAADFTLDSRLNLSDGSTLSAFDQVVGKTTAQVTGTGYFANADQLHFGDPVTLTLTLGDMLLTGADSLAGVTSISSISLVSRPNNDYQGDGTITITVGDQSYTSQNVVYDQSGSNYGIDIFNFDAPITIDPSTTTISLTLTPTTATHVGAGSFKASTGNTLTGSTEALSGGWLPVVRISGSTATPAVPEPATATLSLLALAGLAVRRRRH